jgi:O-antigen/teichoic acid export membrane protein
MMLLITMLTNVVIFAQAYYLRAHKQEVFFVNSVVGALIIAACTVVFGRYYGATGIVVSCCIGNVAGLVWATYKFQKYRKLWHA